MEGGEGSEDGVHRQCCHLDVLREMAEVLDISISDGERPGETETVESVYPHRNMACAVGDNL